MSTPHPRTWVYITQYSFWWSCSTATWMALVDHVIVHGTYDLNTFPGVRALRNRPSSVRVYGRGYYDTKGHTIYRPLDWTIDDWHEAKATTL